MNKWQYVQICKVLRNAMNEDVENMRIVVYEECYDER